MTQQRRAPWIDLVLLTVLALVWIAPLAMMLSIAFTPPTSHAIKLGGLIPGGLSLQNFINVFHDTPIWRHLVNSLIITVSSLCLVLAISSLAAYAFARMNFFAKEFWYYLLIGTLMLPIPALVVPIFGLNKNLGLLNNYFGLILPYTALGAPFALIILRSFFENLPVDVEEAALLEGSSRFQIYWKIVLPMSWPAISVVIIFQFLNGFNEFILAMVTIIDTNLKPLPLVPIVYKTGLFSAPGKLFAVLTLSTIPVIVVYVLMQRFLVRGLGGRD